MILESRYTLSQPIDLGAGDAVELPTHGSFQHYNPIVVIDGSHATQPINDLRSCKGAFDNPVRE